MSNNKQNENNNANNQFSNTEPLTHAQRVAIANTMSNNKKSMKLYTETDLKRAIKKAYLGGMSPFNLLQVRTVILEQLTPIEIPSNEDIWRWWQTQKFQKEQGEQEYTMLYEIDLPKILKSFTEHLIQGGNK